jgi:hypothetical protein
VEVADADWGVSVWGDGEPSEENEKNAAGNIGPTLFSEHPRLKNRMLFHFEEYNFSEILILLILQSYILTYKGEFITNKSEGQERSMVCSNVARTFFFEVQSKEGGRKDFLKEYAITPQDIDLCFGDYSWMVGQPSFLNNSRQIMFPNRP